MVILVTSDNVRFLVQKEVIERSLVIKNMLEGQLLHHAPAETILTFTLDLGDACEDVPLPNVTSSTFNKVLQYCYHHRADPPASEDSDRVQPENIRRNAAITPWDEKFFDMDQDLLFDVILAANYLDIKDLLDDACKIIAKMIVGKTTEEIRQLFNIRNDFTAEEEVRVKRENEWAEEK